jgi:hypothetical protein
VQFKDGVGALGSAVTVNTLGVLAWTSAGDGSDIFFQRFTVPGTKQGRPTAIRRAAAGNSLQRAAAG